VVQVAVYIRTVFISLVNYLDLFF